MYGIDKEFKLRKHPLVCPHGYAMDLYCRYENPDHAFEEFPWHLPNLKSYSDAVRYAKAKGWKLHKDGTATCPKCVKRLSEMKLKEKSS